MSGPAISPPVLVLQKNAHFAATSVQTSISIIEQFMDHMTTPLLGSLSSVC